MVTHLPLNLTFVMNIRLSRTAKRVVSKEGVVCDMLSPITSDQLVRIQRAFRSRTAADKIVGMVGTESVQFGSFLRLRPEKWLNDENINFYMCYLRKRDLRLSRRSGGKWRPSLFYSSHFLAKFAAGGYPVVSRWSKRQAPGGDIFALDKIGIPVNCGGVHWVAIVVYVQERRIQFHDSLCGDGREYLLMVLSYLENEHQQKKKEPLPGPWTLVQVSDSPEQNNGNDCGVFTCMAIDYLSINSPLDYSFRDIVDCRNRMARAVLESNDGCHHTL